MARIYLSGKKGLGKYCLVDDEDYPLLSRFKWNLACGYAVHNYWEGKKHCFIRMHRFVINAKRGMLVDHINQNKLDNRKSNLRECNHSQNRMNTKARKDNKCGAKGVYWKKDRRKWSAQIQIDGKRVCVGAFDEKSMASQAYNEAAKKYYKEFAYLN